jgi:hypothetical protein
MKVSKMTQTKLQKNCGNIITFKWSFLLCALDEILGWVLFAFL